MSLKLLGLLSLYVHIHTYCWFETFVCVWILTCLVGPSLMHTGESKAECNQSRCVIHQPSPYTKEYLRRKKGSFFSCQINFFMKKKQGSNFFEIFITAITLPYKIHKLKFTFKNLLPLYRNK